MDSLDIYEEDYDLSTEMQPQENIYEHPDDFITELQEQTQLFEDPDDFGTVLQQINIYEDPDDLSSEFQQQANIYEESNDLTQDQLLSATAHTGNTYEWHLFDGRQWSHISNDHFIESHYCQPGARGITIYTHLGSLYIDFDALTVHGPFAGLRIQRRTFLSHNQREEVGWYYKDNSQWCEYGSQGSSVNSQNLDQQYNTNPRGSVQFTVGNNAYKMDFPAMTQINLSTHMRRNVRRRPKFNAILSVNSSSSTVAPSSTITPTLSVSSGVIWEFMADEGVWTEYQKPASSLDSVDIEKEYQQNPQGQLSFRAGRYNYILNFGVMYQTNNTFGTKRHIRRTSTGDQQNSNTPAQVRWQYKDMDGCWKDYSKGSRRGACSVSSEDIETQYQQNSRGSMNFRTGSFNYQLDFSAMVQTNLSTNTRRPVRRL